MKRIVIALMALIATSVAFGQNTIADLAGKLDSHKITLNYSCTVKFDVPMKSTGTVTVQQNSYKLSTAGVDIYCDGESRWTVDPSAKEVYIENATGVKEFLSDPQRYLDCLSDVELSNVVIAPLESGNSTFCFNEKALDSSWVVTDLR